ncbi:MAG: hypothetical protein VCF25_29920 [Candidatus Poribacteria bacterium]|jgi:hypothetical protein
MVVLVGLVRAEDAKEVVVASAEELKAKKITIGQSVKIIIA